MFRIPAAAITLLLACALVLLPRTQAPAVVGGTPADPTAGDHVVALIDPGARNSRVGQFCTGTLIAPQWVLTAAHCTNDLRPEQIHVAAGEVDLRKITHADHFTVDRIAQYPLYTPRAWGHDLALLHLTRPIPPSIHPAQERYQRGPRAPYASKGSVSGWGVTEAAPQGSDLLLTGWVSTTTPAQCKKQGAPWGTICGTLPYSSEPSACWGDSGGPLESGGILIGVVSFGPNGCDNSVPTAYTHVGTYSTWIDYVMRGGDPGVSLPEVSSVSGRQLPGGKGIELNMRWCQVGGRGHRLVADFRVAYPSGPWHLHQATKYVMKDLCGSHRFVHAQLHAPGTWTVYAELRDATTGMRYISTYPNRFRIRAG